MIGKLNFNYLRSVRTHTTRQSGGAPELCPIDFTGLGSNRTNTRVIFNKNWIIAHHCCILLEDKYTVADTNNVIIKRNNYSTRLLVVLFYHQGERQTHDPGGRLKCSCYRLKQSRIILSWLFLTTGPWHF